MQIQNKQFLRNFINIKFREEINYQKKKVNRDEVYHKKT